MKSMTKQKLADKAGVSLNTLNRWCKPYKKELEAMGLQPKARLLPPVVVKFIAEKLCIDL
jgi:transposase